MIFIGGAPSLNGLLPGEKKSKSEIDRDSLLTANNTLNPD